MKCSISSASSLYVLKVTTKILCMNLYCSMPTTLSKIMVVAGAAAAAAVIAAAVTAGILIASGGTAGVVIGYSGLVGGATATATAVGVGVLINKIEKGACSIFEAMLAEWQSTNIKDKSIKQWMQRMVITFFKGRNYVLKKIEEGESREAAYNTGKTC